MNSRSISRPSTTASTSTFLWLAPHWSILRRRHSPLLPGDNTETSHKVSTLRVVNFWSTYPTPHLLSSPGTDDLSKTHRGGTEPPPSSPTSGPLNPRVKVRHWRLDTLEPVQGNQVSRCQRTGLCTFLLREGRKECPNSTSRLSSFLYLWKVHTFGCQDSRTGVWRRVRKGSGRKTVEGVFGPLGYGEIQREGEGRRRTGLL